ncbi:hypothetical protein AGMMS49983_13330 [Clostridia bacterium]|nr:hypothetical protein AGMMS49983_13330 [Clostridia bacterium]
MKMRNKGFSGIAKRVFAVLLAVAMLVGMTTAAMANTGNGGGVPFSVEFRYDGEVIKTGTVVSAEGYDEAILPPEALPTDAEISAVVAGSDLQSTVRFLGWTVGNDSIIYTNNEDLLAAGGYAPIGGFVLSGDVIFNAVVDSGSVPGMTIGALGNDGDDDARDDSDDDGTSVTSGADPQSTDGSDGGSVIAGADPQSIQTLGEIGALDAGTITSASISVKYDGEGYLDNDSTAGNDSSYNNKIVRNNDYIGYELHYVTGTPGEVTTVAVLPDGMEWDGSAIYGAKTGSSISDDGKTLTVVRDVNGTANLELKARVYNHNQGDKVNIFSATMDSVAVTGLDTTEVTVSAALNYRVTMGDIDASHELVGPNQDTSYNYSDQAGRDLEYGFGIYAVIDPNKGVKGIAPLDSCTFEVNTTVGTAILSFTTGASVALIGLPQVFSGSQSYTEKGLVNTHTITATGFDTSFKTLRVTTAYGGDAVRADAYYVKTFKIAFWAPLSSLSTTTTTPNTTTLLSTTTGVSPGTSGDESFTDDGMRNTNKTVFPRISDSVILENIAISIGGNHYDLHRGETFLYRVQLYAGGAMAPHSNAEIVGAWDENLAVFDPDGSVTGTTINGYTYTVMYAHVDDINDPSTFASAAWSINKPAKDSPVNAVKLIGSPSATIPAAMIVMSSIPLVVKSDAVIGNIPFHLFYTSNQQALTRADSTQKINPAGIDVDLAWQNEFDGSNVQDTGTMQTLRMTPWVAGNNAGAYNSRDYRTPTEGTAENLRVVVTIPNAAHLLVDESILIAALDTTYPGLGASVTSAEVGGNTVLTFDFASPVTYNGALPPFDIPVSATIGTIGTYNATAVISSVSDNINQNYRQDTTAQISFNRLNAFVMQKTVSPQLAQPGSEVTWALRYANFSNVEVTGIKLVDVLPYNGDGRGTGSGTSGLSTPLTITAVNAGSATVEYTEDAPAAVVAALGTDPTGGTGILWTSGTPSATDGATALRFTVAGPVAVEGEGLVTFTAKIGAFAGGGVLYNDAWGTTAGLPTFNPAAPPVASVASVISGKVYKDSDFSGGYTNETDDVLQSNVVVTLTTTDPTLQTRLSDLFGSYSLTTTTNVSGAYHFANLPSGDYTVSAPAVSNFPHFKFIEPAGTNTHTVTLGTSDSVTKDFGLQATRWNLSYNVNTPDGATATGVTLPVEQPNISTASASAAVGVPTNVPVRTDGGGVYTFAGWAATAAHATAGTVDYPAATAATDTVPAQAADTNYVLYAVWTYSAITWNLVFDKNIPAVPAGVDGSAVTAPASQTISTANASAILTAPTGLPTAPNGTFVFAGWNTAADGSGDDYAVGSTVLKQAAGATVTLYAKWTYTATSWNLTYDANKPADAVGTPSAPPNQMNIPEGSASAAVGTITGQYPKSDGSGYYTFNGWASDKNGAAPTYSATQTVPAQAAGTTKTIYGTWNFSLNSFEYTITHHFIGGPNGGTSIVVPGGTALFGQTIVAPTDTVYTGYTHNAAHPSAVPSGTIGAGGLALHLYYQAIPCIITFDANGGELNTGGNILFYPGIDYGTLWSASGIAVPTATLSGYTFSGWSPVVPGGSTAITASATYTAQWTYNPPPPPPTPPTPPPVNPPPVPVVPPPVVVVETEPEQPVPPVPPAPTPPAPVAEIPEPQEPETPTYTDISVSYQEQLDAQTGNLFRDLANGNVPLGSFFGNDAWSLLSLILSLIAVIVSLLLIVRAVVKRREHKDAALYEDAETDEEKKERRKYTMVLRVTTIVIGFLTLVVWLLLDDLSLPMVWINKWTIFVAVVFLVHIIFLAVYRYNKAKEEKEDEEDGETGGSQPMTA